MSAKQKEIDQIRDKMREMIKEICDDEEYIEEIDVEEKNEIFKDHNASNKKISNNNVSNRKLPGYLSNYI